MTTVAEATEALRWLQHAAGGDPFGVRTIEGARAAYLRGEIELDEFERRVELFLSGQPIAIIQPGESVITGRLG